jgi:hypothetical protein
MMVEVQFLYVLLTTLVASGIGTIAGFGTSTIMVPALMTLFPVPETLLFVGIMHWFGNIWKMLLFRRGIRWRLILTFGIPGTITSFLGASIALSLPQGILLRVIGVLLVLYALLVYLKPYRHLPETTATAVGGGAFYGFLAGATGMGGEIRSAVLTSFNLHKACYISTAGAVATTVDSARLATYLSRGVVLGPPLLSGIIILIVASLVGSYLGKRIVDKIPQERFRMVVATFILVAGVRLAMIPSII